MELGNANSALASEGISITLGVRPIGQDSIFRKFCMKEILKLLLQLTNISPILAFRALFDWEGDFGEPDEDQYWTRQVGNSRGIYVRGCPEPILMAQMNGENIKFRASESLGMDSELCLLIAALGLTAKPDGDEFVFMVAGHESETGYIHAESIWDRVRDMDEAWCLNRGIGSRLGSSAKVRIERLSEIFTRAAEWCSIRMRSFLNETEEPDFNLQFTELKLKDLTTWKIDGLQEVKVEFDVRGTAFAFVFADRPGIDIHVSGFKLDGEPSKIFNPAAYAAAMKKQFGKYDVRPTVIKPDVHAVLAGCTVEGNEVFIRQRLSSKLYKKVNEALNAIGGQWHTGRQSHVFDEDPAALIESVVATGAVYTRKDYEFFWTSKELSYKAIQLADLEAGETVLEPSAGDGALALPAAEIVGKSNVTCFELMPKNVQALRELGFGISKPTDFLETIPREEFDAVIMNPPFSGGKDAAHIEHAFKWLKPGGRLVAIASTQWQTHETKPAERFRSWLKGLGAKTENVPRGAFKDAGTDVETVLIVINKPLALAKAPVKVVKNSVPAAPVVETEQFEMFA